MTDAEYQKMSDRCYLCGNPADLEIEVKEANVKKDVCEDCAIRLMAHILGECVIEQVNMETTKDQ